MRLDEGAALRRSGHHANVRVVLDLCWPDLDLREQMKRTSITESVLCSGPGTHPTRRSSEEHHRRVRGGAAGM
jgi:hypothetical protein